MLPFAYVCTHKTTVKSTNRSFNFDSLHRKSPLYSVTLDAGPLQWRGEVSIRGSPPGDACFWVVRRLQVLGCSHSCPTSLTYAFCFSLSTQRLYLSDHVCLSVVRTGCPLCETAPDGWMDVSVLGRTGIIQWTDRGSVFCSAFFFVWSSSFGLPSLELLHLVVGTCSIYSSGFDHLLCVWCGKYLVEGVQRDPVWKDRTSATDKAPFLAFFLFNLCVMYVEWR